MNIENRSKRERMVIQALIVLFMMSCVVPASLRAEQTGNPPIGKSNCIVKPVFDPEGVLQITDLVTFNDAYYIVQRTGRISRFSSKDYSHSYDLLDWADRIEIRGWEQGLLGLTFPPDAENDSRFYIYYTRKGKGTVVISEIQKSTSGTVTERVILTVPQPYDNHNGGFLRFGPDGYLYAGLGDGGHGGDPHGYAQDRNSVLGSVIRINPEKATNGKEYSIPNDNPYVGHPTFRQEIFIYGLRNPWRMDFASDGSLYIADVGQVSFEEVSRARKGDNMGWNIQEGFSCFEAKRCKRKGLRQPLFDYGRTEGISVTGGIVYQGSKLSGLQDSFIFGDFGSGKIWAVREEQGKARVTELLDSSLAISAFGTLVDGEPAIINYSEGNVYTLSCDKISFQP